MNKFASKFAASTMVITLAMVGCHSDSMMSPASASAAQRSDQQAARLSEQAQAASRRGDIVRALRLAERAVELAPNDAGYRMLLADLYLRNGRFRSAEASYGDVLDLDPNNIRAGLSIALSQIALGRTSDALAELEELASVAPASDVGLAFALAGQPQRAIELLEPAARAPDANGRTRQNLALAFALAGDWQRARIVAAQDVSPAELGPRLMHWARLAQPTAPHSQVATLLGVTPVEDPGQPVRLALARPEPQAEAHAEAAPAPEPALEAPVQYAEAQAVEPEATVEEPIRYAEAGEPVAEPIRYAEAPAVPAPAPAPAPVSVATTAGEEPVRSASWWPSEGGTAATITASVSVPADTPAGTPAPAPARYAAAVSSLSTAQPVLTRSTVQPARAARPVFRPAPVRRATASVSIPRAGSGAGRFVVQLGAFSNPQNAERAWLQAERRFGLANAEASTTTINMNGRTLHRVSVSGFSSRGEASRLCSSIQSRGGACFVRATAGDSPVRWASRSTRSRRA